MEVQHETNKAVIAAVETLGFPVGNGQDPEPLRYPYVVIYPFDTPDFAMSGPVSDRFADRKLRFSVVSVGKHPDQTSLLAERVRDLLSDRQNITPQIGVVMGTSPFLLGRMVRDDEVRPSTFTISDIWIVQITQ